jgi:hypothetical protein
MEPETARIWRHPHADPGGNGLTADSTLGLQDSQEVKYAGFTSRANSGSWTTKASRSSAASGPGPGKIDDWLHPGGGRALKIPTGRSGRIRATEKRWD